MPTTQLAAQSPTVNGQHKKDMQEMDLPMLQCYQCHLLQCPHVKIKHKKNAMSYLYKMMCQGNTPKPSAIELPKLSFKANIRAERNYLRMSEEII